MEYISELLVLGTSCINILLMNLQNSATDPTSTTFLDTIVSWYKGLCLHARLTTTTADVENKIFLAFGTTPPPCP
jgi:hypothetical protein